MEDSNTSSSPETYGSDLKIAVHGCGHGALDDIYTSVEMECEAKGWTVSDDLDFLIICGDFQAVRNEFDLNCMSVPPKYRQLGDFHKYYSGEKKAPVLTLVIGGNHEASNYFYELYHGGWLAPNIYYLGAANVVRYGPCRIAGLSGIFKCPDYRKPHGERLPYSRDDIRSIYHVREYDIRKLLHIRSQVDIGLSHDWPAGIELFGNYKDLFAKKPHFLESAKVDNLGSKPATQVLDHLRPAYWFSGHMHVKFPATVEHNGDQLEDAIDNLTISDNLKRDLPILTGKTSPRKMPQVKKIPPRHTEISNTVTKFLALDKIGPHRQSLELMEIKPCSRTSTDQEEQEYLRRNERGKYNLQYDVEWLALTRAFTDALIVNDGCSSKLKQAQSERTCVQGIPKHMGWVKENIVAKGLLNIPENFVAHAPLYASSQAEQNQQPREYPNLQTAQFYSLLQLPNKFALPS